MPNYRIEVDRDVCQGFGACEELCPDWFKVSEADRKTTIRGGKRLSGALEALEISGELGCRRDAAEACPFNAIHVFDVEKNVSLV